MKNFFETLRNIWKINDLRGRILLTLGLILVYRIGCFVILPGVDSKELSGATSGLGGLLDLFTGGAFNNASIFALGIMPYISASIIMQLAGIAVPAIQKLQREGESGRKKINQWTRYLTIIICFFQAPTYLQTYVYGAGNAVVYDTWLWYVSAVTILISGTMFVVWIGERITDKGIGNGISLLIMIGIIARFPGALIEEMNFKMDNMGMVIFLVEIVFFVLVIAFCILLVQGTRRIPIQHAKRVVGGRGGRQMLSQGQRQYLPLKVNAAGVMPIIFAQAIMFIPALMFGGSTFADIFGFWYNVVFGLMIIVFTYFYTAVTVDPNRIADDLKRSGGFIPGVKPGRKTAEFIDSLLSRITLPGSILLALVAVLPAFAHKFFGVQQNFALFYGGTSLLIMVGVVLDTLQQIESHLLSNHYDGLMKGTKIKGRGSSLPPVGQAF